MEYGLPKSVTLDGSEFAIRYDYRVILEIFEAINDYELTEEERALAVLQIFYIDFDELTDYSKALTECFRFINGGRMEQTGGKKQPKLVDWEQDFSYIVAPVNHILSTDVRGIQYDKDNNTGGLHWWTFLSAYLEITGDCLFAQIVSIREKKARGKPLDKSDRDFYNRNRDIVDIKTRYTDEENEVLRDWIK